MRDIKFRAWFHDTQEMKNVETNNLYKGNKSSWLYLSPHPASNYRSVEVMQYTGFEDDEDTEIYGGDIIEFCDFNSLRTGGIEDDVIHVSVVKMSKGSWIVENGKHQDYLYQVLINDSDAKVIGNIYENPELLVNEGGA